MIEKRMNIILPFEFTTHILILLKDGSISLKIISKSAP